ncbi:uncharacterized protein LOC126375579 [Pectinophora gossypiella]|uniref:uncharacterized protein LOC126375579 n=1 Tax=Pectinophora gossypiella TaxID=13191 RepID=UPI00214E79E5|nr:uncharacterized protein LOC126375579 [Pectinophora gossypiella]
MRSRLITFILFTTIVVQHQCFISKKYSFPIEEAKKPLMQISQHSILTPIDVWHKTHNEKVTNKESNEETKFNDVEKIKTATIATIVDDPETSMDDGIVEDYDDDTDLDNEPVQMNEDTAMKNYNRDRQQFKAQYNIFTINKATKTNRVLNNDIQTEANDNTSKARLKRSTNVIEEENLGTTISGFKFTGRPTHLHHNLAFKNINS